MKRMGVAVALAACLLFVHCKDNDEVYDWPVWILNVLAVTYGDEGGVAPVSGCPSVTWHYTGSTETDRVGCRDGNRVKVWRHIDNDVTIVYQVHCGGYRDSPIFTTSYLMANIVQGPGRDGPEVVHNHTVFMQP
jgi:hypothetical protein